jgi:hypothetical protein
METQLHDQAMAIRMNYPESRRRSIYLNYSIVPFNHPARLALLCPGIIQVPVIHQPFKD